MKTSLILAALACATIALPAMAQDAAPGAACARPPAPTKLDGATATMEQLVAAKQATSTFMTASDDYQACVIKDLTDQKAAAKAAKKTFPSAQTKAANELVDANQADKVSVGQSFNEAVKAYKAAHPA